jgi:pyruvate/2-oxoglutarate dehydrogenase complex dihydrolipoamide acyltransferase (E2) component
MTQILRIPKAAVSMREGTLVQWLVPDGSTVAEGQPIFTLELEKSTMDIEAPASGVIRQTGQAGTTYKVGEVIGEIGEPATDAQDQTLRRMPVSRLVTVVADLQSSMTAWRDTLGAGPFFVFPHLAFTSFAHRGDSSNQKPDVSIAVGSAGGLLIELVQQHNVADSAWQEAGIGATMIAVTAEDFNGSIAIRESAGDKCISIGSYPFGARFAIVDTHASTGHWLIILEKHFFLDQISDKIRAASREWDGRALTADLK